MGRGGVKECGLWRLWRDIKNGEGGGNVGCGKIRNVDCGGIRNVDCGGGKECGL